MQVESTPAAIVCAYCERPLSPYQIAQQFRCCSRQCGNKGRTRPASERFWRFVEPGEGCWEWRGTRMLTGYGQIRSGGKDTRWMYAHRLSWEVHFGPIPEGMKVCHRCDNPPCVRPDHLFIGTDADNVADKVSKGRQLRGDNHPSRRRPDLVRRGEAKPMAKLTEDIVRAIRAEHAAGTITMAALARRYGVSPSIISVVVARKTWRHVV